MSDLLIAPGLRVRTGKSSSVMSKCSSSGGKLSECTTTSWEHQRVRCDLAGVVRALPQPVLSAVGACLVCLVGDPYAFVSSRPVGSE